jgi:hypothetical protein
MNLSDKHLRRFWSKVALPDDNGCMLWLGTTATYGYGTLRAGAANLRAHRVTLWLSEGPPPSSDSEAAHACRNRHCVAPLHLRWASRTENAQDRLRDGTNPHGTAHGIAKLSDQQVTEIRHRYSTPERPSQRQLAAEYGVSQSTISTIVNRVRWTHVTGGAA